MIWFWNKCKAKIEKGKWVKCLREKNHEGYHHGWLMSGLFYWMEE